MADTEYTLKTLSSNDKFFLGPPSFDTTETGSGYVSDVLYSQRNREQ